MMAMMGYARVELGEHYPTDVLGGWLIGLLLVVGLAWLHRTLSEPAPVEETVDL
jgi:membrane-associated phospholipid phosphatase